MSKELIVGKGRVACEGIDRWYQCQRKKAYENVKTAKKRAREFGQHVYECPQCGNYHLTNTEQNA